MTDAQPLINACHVEDVQAWQHSKLIAISKLAQTDGTHGVLVLIMHATGLRSCMRMVTRCGTRRRGKLLAIVLESGKGRNKALRLPSQLLLLGRSPCCTQLLSTRGHAHSCHDIPAHNGHEKSGASGADKSNDPDLIIRCAPAGSIGNPATLRARAHKRLEIGAEHTFLCASTPATVVILDALGALGVRALTRARGRLTGTWAQGSIVRIWARRLRLPQHTRSAHAIAPHAVAILYAMSTAGEGTARCLQLGQWNAAKATG
mmetsp:Transcript_33699/g.49318  ORF Transcript_33699/g.49318 Transcript_33699/m.49318 type:complete len:261 (+) Transcript_33699:1126-1908(+)